MLGGENALPCFSPNGVDAVALERIVYNTQVRACSWRDIQIPCMGAASLEVAITVAVPEAISMLRMVSEAAASCLHHAHLHR